MVFICTLVSSLHSVCRTCVINLTRFALLHNLNEWQITQMDSFYQDVCSHLQQVNAFHSYSCKHTTFCMRDKCYQCDKISPNTQPEGVGNNSVVLLLSELLFTLGAGECFSFVLLKVHYILCSGQFCVLVKTIQLRYFLFLQLEKPGHINNPLAAYRIQCA